MGFWSPFIDAGRTWRGRAAVCLSVGLGDALELILLLDGVRVGRAVGGVDQLVSKALGDGLDVAE